MSGLSAPRFTRPPVCIRLAAEQRWRNPVANEKFIPASTKLVATSVQFDSLFSRASPQSVGLCGKSIEMPDIVNPIRGRMFRCETVNRGPWVVLKSDLERHGYLDERYFFQGNDDHDYHRRVFEVDRRRPLYVPIALSSPLALGAARRTRTGLNREVFAALEAEKRGSPAFHRFLAARRSSAPPEAIS